MTKSIIRLGALAGAIVAIVGAWHLFGFPEVAWSSDVKRLDSQQTDTAISVYQQSLDSALITQGLLSDPGAKALNSRRIDDATQTLKDLRQHKIELSK